MNEKFNKNAKDEKLTNMLGIAVRLIVIDPYYLFSEFSKLPLQFRRVLPSVLFVKQLQLSV